MRGLQAKLEKSSPTLSPKAQVWSAGFFAGRVLTGEHGKEWLRGNFEYAFGLMPVFETYGNQHIHGWGFDPLILRWNLALHTNRVSPYIELAEAASRPMPIFHRTIVRASTSLRGAEPEFIFA